MSEIRENVYNKIIIYVLGIPVSFLILFIVVSMVQLHEINSRIEEGQSQTLREMVIGVIRKDSLSELHRQFLALAVLEEESLSERYRQGHYSLVSRSFKQFLGFFTGIIMVIVGCVFVLLKLQEEIKASGSAGKQLQFALITGSPGIVFGIVGAVLIAITSTTNDKITVRDSGLYLTREYLVAPFFSEKGYQLDMNEFMNNTEAVDNQTNEDPQKTQSMPLVKSSEPSDTSKIAPKARTNKEITIQHPPKNQ